MSNAGVPLGELSCPTCGEIYTDFNFRSDPDEILLTQAASREIIPRTLWYLLCPSGHKWTVRYIHRRLNEPDEVLLGQYLGEL